MHLIHTYTAHPLRHNSTPRPTTPTPKPQDALTALPLVTRANASTSTTKANLTTHSIYDLSSLPNDIPNIKIITDTKDKLTASVYNVVDALQDNRNVRGLYDAPNLFKFELDHLVDTAIVFFDTVLLICPLCGQTHYKCMTPAINKTYAALQMEMRGMDPMKVTRGIVHGWLRVFLEVFKAYKREVQASGYVCEGLVGLGAKQEFGPLKLVSVLEIHGRWACLIYVVT